MSAEDLKLLESVREEMLALFGLRIKSAEVHPLATDGSEPWIFILEFEDGQRLSIITSHAGGSSRSGRGVWVWRDAESMMALSNALAQLIANPITKRRRYGRYDF